MSDSNNTTKNVSGVSFFGLLTIVFITLKLTGHIAWSWWWVLAPLWLPITIFIVGIIVLALVAGLVAGIKAVKDEKAKRRAFDKNKMN